MAKLSKTWASNPKVMGSNPTAARQKVKGMEKAIGNQCAYMVNGISETKPQIKNPYSDLDLRYK